MNDILDGTLWVQPAGASPEQSPPERALLAAIVSSAIGDLRTTPTDDEISEQRNRAAGREEDATDPHGAADFVFGPGEWFPLVCAYLGLDAETVRASLLRTAERDARDARGGEKSRRGARALLLRVRFYRRWLAMNDRSRPDERHCA